MRELTHDNLCAFVGAYVGDSKTCYLTQHCSRGSLQDVIMDDDIALDSFFRISLISDVANGLAFLHKSSIRSHGHLTSAECFVDSRWVLKIAGFGLHAFRDRPTAAVVGEYVYYRNLLWTAPELLRLSPQQRPVNGTQKGDIYSFAIIVQEIAYRAQPYFCDQLHPKMIIERIRHRQPPFFRPDVNLAICENIDYNLLSMMTDCWAEKPQERPNVYDLLKAMRKFNGGQQFDIVNSMLTKLEKYADNLEGLVQNRTAELEHEKLKTDMLLYRMLPPFVANQLKAGCKVEPQFYDSATIYFSDIVGFTTLSSESTPFEVVDLLNDLYTTFDDVTSRHDVYKVETIGDAYMVVSGLPKVNEGRHIVEICNLALDLLDEVSIFKVRHRPNETLRLRIGLHTGPCAAGVVGHAMPRYCLFGDTVNTASRMESTGEALRIHMSASAHEALVQYPGYITEPRSATGILVKGKGTLHTFWLLGKQATTWHQIDDQGVKVTSPDIHSDGPEALNDPCFISL